MKRSIFLQLAMAAASSLALPFTSMARLRTPNPDTIPNPESGLPESDPIPLQRADKGFFVAAGKDRQDKSISLFEGDTFNAKVSTADTNGDIYMFESSREKKGGPPLHVHYEQDEWWYVLKGEFIIKVGDQIFNVKAGDSVFGPRKIPHAFAKIGEGEAKLLMFFQPAGKMEAFFTAMSQGATNNMTPQQNIEFRKAHGFEPVGPPLSYLKQ